MNNLNLWAFPRPISGDSNTILRTEPEDCGFTKLELAALMIAQGMVHDRQNYHLIPSNSVELAKAVLEEANK